MRKLIEDLASFASRLRLGNRLSGYRVAKGVRVALWRIKASGDNQFEVGADSMVRTKIVFERPGAGCRIGERSFVGDGIFSIGEGVDIGSDVLISWGVSITDHNSHSLKFGQRANDLLLWRQGQKRWDGIAISPVRICDKAWIGFNAMILKGVTIGEGAIVGAGSVVTKDVAPWTIVAGNPARLIREIPPNER